MFYQIPVVGLAFEPLVPVIAIAGAIVGAPIGAVAAVLSLLPRLPIRLPVAGKKATLLCRTARLRQLAVQPPQCEVLGPSHR